MFKKKYETTSYNVKKEKYEMTSSQNLSPKTKVRRWLKYKDLENKHSFSLLPNQQNIVLHSQQDEILH